MQGGRRTSPAGGPQIHYHILSCSQDLLTCINGWCETIENDAREPPGAPRNAQAQPTRVCLRDADVASSPVIGRAYGSRSSNGSLRTAEITRDNRAGCGWYDFRVARETKVFHAFCATVGRKTF